MSSIWPVHVLLVLFVFGVGCGKIDPCGNEVLARQSSPAGAYQAIVFERDCGATTDFSTQVSILPSDVSFLERPSFWSATEQGNALAIDADHGAAPRGAGGGPDVTIHWESDQKIILAYHPRARVFLAAPSVGAVSVEHRKTAELE